MRVITFSLTISADEYLRFYRGSTRFVRVRADSGQHVQFPAEHLRKFVTHDGIKGRFALRFDKNNKFTALEKI